MGAAIVLGMETVNVYDAKTHLSRLLDRVGNQDESPQDGRQQRLHLADSVLLGGTGER